MGDKEIVLQQAEILLDHLKMTTATITKEFVNHRLDLIKDINTITAVLIPAFLVFVSKEVLINRCFFWAGMTILVSLLFINLLYRRRLIMGEEKLLINIEKYGQKLQDKILDVKKHENIEDFKKLDEILQESFKPLAPPKTWFQKYGEIVIYIMFILGILCLTVSLTDISNIKAILINNKWIFQK